MTSTLTTESVDQLEDDRATARPSILRRLFAGSATWVFLLNILLIGVFTWLSPQHVFFSLPNLQSQLLNGSVALLLALAMATLLSAGMFDLSLGSNLVLSSVVGAITMKSVAATSPNDATIAILLGLLASVLTGIAYGIVNGVLIGYLRVNSLIATLGTLSIGLGFALLLTGGADIAGLPSQLQTGFGLARLFGLIPLPALVAIGVAIVLWAMFRFTTFGINTLALGSSRLAVERAGLKVRRQIVGLTSFAGMLAGLSGFISLSQYAATTTQGHANDALAAVTAAVIGGTALTGGRISVIGTVWGTALAGILLGGLVTIGVLPFWQYVAVGSILIIAVVLDQFRRRQRS
ncbi:ABC transporter permease [Microbacterium aoyamense]|uniref:ABC transporter permease n=1 Tax=Microbacterium aoyamense TaxID=344166 RepID=A0ABN2PDR9_9MICO|nr:ABC transporter permease [Microbacterium aoyamense]